MKKHISKLCKVLFFAAIGILFLWIDAKNSSVSPKASQGRPVVYVQQQPDKFDGCAQIADDGNNIYLLINDHKGLVQVYDILGNYEQSIVLYSHTNGAFKLAEQNGVIFICDKEGSLYLFEQGFFVKYIVHSEAVQLRKSIDFENYSSSYYQRNGSIWRTDGEQSKCVIQGEILPGLHIGNPVIILTGIILALAMIRLYRKNT
jgi:hypothetical protein